jgi:hypothetical protein
VPLMTPLSKPNKKPPMVATMLTKTINNIFSLLWVFKIRPQSASKEV